MKLATYQDDGIKTGVVVDGLVFDTGLAQPMTEIIADWAKFQPLLEAAVTSGSGKPLDAVTLCAPVLRPGKIWAIGLNYADHIAEANMPTPEHQVWFTKAVTSLNGPFAPIEIARGSTTVDYEIELVAIIGKRARHVSAADAKDYVFGYCTGNDVSEREWQRTTPQWSLGKSFDTHGPIGPWITTADEVGDPHALEIRCLVNGEVRQHSNTKHLVFNVWEQIEQLSTAMTLEPGDVIFTGTCGGVGVAMQPPQYLKAGDVVRCEIEKLGAIEGTMIDEPHR